jgi:hypothetical protein
LEMPQILDKRDKNKRKEKRVGVEFLSQEAS